MIVKLASRLLNCSNLGAFLVFLLATSQVASAQSLPGQSQPTQTAKSVKLPEPLTRQAIRDLISGLDDTQVRQLLIKRLSAQADARAKKLAEHDDRSILQILDGYRHALGVSIYQTVMRLQQVPSVSSRIFSNFEQQRGSSAYLAFLIWLALALVIGAGAVWLLRRLTQNWEQRTLSVKPVNLWQKLGLITVRFAYHIALILAFMLTSYAFAALHTEPGSPDRYTYALIIQTIGWIWIVNSVARFIMAPSKPQLRLCPLDDATANLLTSRTTLIATIAGLGFGLLAWMLKFGMSFGELRLGFWVTLAVHIAIIVTIWQARHGIVAMLTADETPDSRRSFSLSRNWPMIAITIVAAHWLIIEIMVATNNATAGILPVMMITLATLIMLPILDHGIRALVHNAAPIDSEANAPLQAAQTETQRGLARCGRVVLGIGVVLFLLRIWNVDPHELAEQGVGARFASGTIDIFLIALIWYALWEAVTILSERQLAIERAVMGVDDTDEAMAEGEGGKGETRLATIVPLLRLTARILIAAIGGFAIVQQLGINITPLLAGFGIIGLAIGFGAQTLVKDVISGLFFLIDDAFRKGEYIDIGTVKGTVEKISVRSMQLRHHNGPLNTVPFGEINFITNFSRDWVVMKLPLRLTYDTDAEAVRKMIKKLGQDLLSDPQIGDQFLQPLKSQGVIQMEDSAQIMRVKFMTRPGDQWLVRRVVFARIRELFEREGIKFAHREVTVRFADQDPTLLTDERETKVAGAAARSVIDPEPAKA